jgi:hypothetical protein
MVRLRDALPDCGSQMSPAAFRELVLENFAQNYSNWTDEELLFEPREAMKFCKAIRTQCDGKLSDNLILRTLINARKNRK